MDSDSEPDGNDQADKSVTEEDMIRSRPATAGSLQHKLESYVLTENTVTVANV